MSLTVGDRRRRHQDRRRRRRRAGHDPRAARASSRRPTDTEAIEDAIADLVAELRGRPRGRPRSASAPPASSTARRSTVLFAPNLAWRDEPCSADLEQRIDLPVVVENDANAAAWGEFTLRRRRGRRRPPAGHRRHRRRRRHRARRRAATAARSAWPPRSGTCASSRTGGSAAAATAAAGSSTPAAPRWSATTARGRPRRARCSRRDLLDRAGGDVDGDQRAADHRGRAGRRPVRASSSSPTLGTLARRGHRHPGRGARPGRGRDRRRRLRGRRPAADPVRAAFTRNLTGRGTGPCSRSAAPRSATTPG